MNLEQIAPFLGMNAEETLARFGGNEPLLMRCLKKFNDDRSFDDLKTAMEQGQKEEAIAAVHTLKGVSGNLGLGTLFTKSQGLLAHLRQEGLEGAQPLYQDTEQAYAKTMEILSGLE